MTARTLSTPSRASTRGTARPASTRSARVRSLVPRSTLVWGARIAGAAVAATAGLSLVVFPLRDYVEQRQAIADKRFEFETLADANEQLQFEVNRLSTPEGIRNAARSQLGYVLPGEQRLSLVQMPTLPIDLPDAWPYTLVTDILRVRTAAASSGGALAPLAP